MPAYGVSYCVAFVEELRQLSERERNALGQTDVGRALARAADVIDALRGPTLEEIARKRKAEDAADAEYLRERRQRKMGRSDYGGGY